MYQLQKILTEDFSSIIAFILFISIFIEVVPIKINPLSLLIHWIGDKLNKDTKESLSSISLQLDNMSYRIDKIEINDMRSTILDFTNSCMNGQNHTKEEFEHIIDLYTAYEEVIEKCGIKNGRIDLAYKYISELYTTCLKENSFLDSNN